MSIKQVDEKSLWSRKRKASRINSAGLFSWQEEPNVIEIDFQVYSHCGCSVCARQTGSLVPGRQRALRPDFFVSYKTDLAKIVKTGSI